MALFFHSEGVKARGHAWHARGVLVMKSQSSPTHSIGLVGTANNERHVALK